MATQATWNVPRRAIPRAIPMSFEGAIHRPTHAT